jgi:hypothetical protein
MLYVCNFYSIYFLYSEILFPRYLNSVNYSMIFLLLLIIYSLRISLPHISIYFVFDVDIFKLYFLAILLNLCSAKCNSSSELVLKY